MTYVTERQFYITQKNKADGQYYDSCIVNVTGDVSIAEATSAGSVRMYPNPVVDGKLTVTLAEGSQGVQAEVYTVQGVRAGSYRLTGGENTIDVSHLPSGIYIVKVGNATKKAFINR